jgi:hypothetical protein
MDRDNLQSAMRWLLCFTVCAIFAASSAVAQNPDSDEQDKNFDVRSSVGDMHLGSDATPHELGLPVYPGSRLRKHDDNNSNANLSLFTSSFGFKLVVANYDSDDSPDKIIAFYRGKLKKYGKVLECHTSKESVTTHAGNDDDSSKSKELKCDGDNKGPVVELKVGTEDDQHDVEIEPAESGHGTTFALVYVRSRGKQADI